MILTDGDLSLINLLKVNARASVSELARKLGVSRTTAQDRLTRLEERGVITGYTVRLSAETSEAGVSAYVMISFEPGKAAAIVKTLKTFSAIETLQSVSGKIDLMARVGVDTPEALDRLLDKVGAIDGVVSTESALVLSTKLDRGLAA